MTRDIIIKRARSACPDDPPYVIQCASGKAILRCSPESKEDAMIMMSKIDPLSSPLITSGTLRKIRQRYPELKQAKNRPG
jgi:RNase P/RNase MRP subunit POP5